MLVQSKASSLASIIRRLKTGIIRVDLVTAGIKLSSEFQATCT